MWRLVFPILAYVLFAAHLLFHGLGLVVALLGLLPVVFIGFRHKIAVYAHMGLLIIIGLEWLRAMWALVELRLAYGMDWKLAAAILIGCAVFSFASAWIVYRRRV